MRPNDAIGWLVTILVVLVVIVLALKLLDAV